MKRLGISLVLSSAAALGLLWAAHVSTDYNHHTDFGMYHTYSWIGVNAGDSLWSDRIQRDVDQQLTSKGWSKVPAGGDAAVSAIGAVKTQQTFNTFYNGFPGWFWGGFDETATTTVQNIPVGTLVVDIFDGRTKKLIWRSEASETLSSKPEKNDRKLEDTIADMFKKFPPKGQG